jgi:hypothetical protein
LALLWFRRIKCQTPRVVCGYVDRDAAAPGAEIARLHALQADALVAVASADRVVDEFALIDPVSSEERRIRIEDAVREEVAAALRWSPSMAQARIDQARLLAGPLDQVREALVAGEISPRHVGVIAEAAGRLPGAVDRFRRDVDGQPDARAIAAEAEFAAACEQLERRVLPTACRSTVARTRQATRRAVLAIDADGQRRRHLQARCAREVYVADGEDGISTLVARLSTPDAHAVFALVDAVAHDLGDEPEGCRPRLTIGERRAEALAALVLARDGSSAVVQARVDVVVDLPTLLGLAERAGELAGCGAGEVPVSADAIRELIADPRIAVSLRRLVTDPVTGHLLDCDRRSYQVPDALRAFLVARDQTCRFPGCARPADPLPGRPRPRVGRRRLHRRYESRGPVHQTPPVEDTRRLGHPRQQPRRLLHLALAPRSRL